MSMEKDQIFCNWKKRSRGHLIHSSGKDQIQTQEVKFILRKCKSKYCVCVCVCVCVEEEGRRRNCTTTHRGLMGQHEGKSLVFDVSWQHPQELRFD
jgi:inosine/xanthosine triphosphate pyrophosphatase family protein